MEARAWHGQTPPGWPAGTYEDGSEGTILFDGQIKSGENSLHAAHGIEFKIPQNTSVNIAATATNGPIKGELFAEPILPKSGTARWEGPIGLRQSPAITLKTDDGPIQIDFQP